MDVVGYSKLLLNEQREIQRQLNQIVRSAAALSRRRSRRELIRLPVGDGMALVFFNSPEAPVQCGAGNCRGAPSPSRIEAAHGSS